MSEEATPVRVRILDKEYQVACKPEEERELRDSAQLLDERMREIHQTGRVIGTDRIAVMAALNIAHELIQHQSAHDHDLETTQRLQSLQERVESALSEAATLDGTEESV